MYKYDVYYTMYKKVLALTCEYEMWGKFVRVPLGTLGGVNVTTADTSGTLSLAAFW